MKNFSLSFKLWYPELTSIRERYFALLSFGRISFRVGPLWMGLICAWFRHTGSKHNLITPLAMGTNTKLLHHSADLSTPSSAIMSSFCSLSNSSWNGFWSMYATWLSSAWYGLLSDFICKENVPSKHPKPLNTSSKYICICYVASALFFLLLSKVRPERKYSVVLLDFVSTVGFVLLSHNFEMLSMFV